MLTPPSPGEPNANQRRRHVGHGQIDPARAAADFGQDPSTTVRIFGAPARELGFFGRFASGPCCHGGLGTSALLRAASNLLAGFVNRSMRRL